LWIGSDAQAVFNAMSVIAGMRIEIVWRSVVQQIAGAEISPYEETMLSAPVATEV
jgi:hypothetical protein